MNKKLAHVVDNILEAAAAHYDSDCSDSQLRKLSLAIADGMAKVGDDSLTGFSLKGYNPRVVLENLSIEDGDVAFVHENLKLVKTAIKDAI